MRVPLRIACVIGLLLLAAVARSNEPFPAELVEFGPPSGHPLFAGGGPDAWDRDLRERGWIMREGNRWALWYTGSNPDRDPVRRLGLATSTDGRVFTNVDDEPVLACGPEPYDRHAIAVDQIVRHAGRYYAYYHSSPREDRATWQTCLATSTDLVHWTKYRGNPILPVDPEAPKRSSATLVHDGQRFRLYTTHPDVRVRFGVRPQPVGSAQ